MPNEIMHTEKKINFLRSAHFLIAERENIFLVIDGSVKKIDDLMKYTSIEKIYSARVQVRGTVNLY